MGIELLKQQNIAASTLVQTGEVNNANIFVNSDPIVKGGEVGAPVDTLSTGNTVQARNNNLRTAKQVKDALSSIATRSGLSLEKLLDIIQKMTGKSLIDLQNVKQKELNNITVGLGKILKSCMVKGKIDSIKLEQAINDYNIAIQTGWTLNGFYKQQQNVKKSTLVERLIETNCLSGSLDLNGPDYDAKMEAAIEKFFEKTLLSRINKNTPQDEREQIYKAQLQTYGRLLINTTEGRDKELLGSAIDKLYRKNIVSAAQAGLQAMETEDAKANFAKHIDFKEAVTTDSKYEEDVYMTKEAAIELANLKYGNMRAKDIETDMPLMRQEALEFFEKNKEILEIIDEKIKNNEELTKEEQAIQRERENLHIGRYSGAATGIASNKNSTVVSKKEEFLKVINSDAYKIGEKAGNDFYREVLTQVANYAESLPEDERVEFDALMQKTIGENYAKVANDIANGTTTELSVPLPNAENNIQPSEQTIVTSTKETFAFGYYVNEVPSLASSQTLTAQLYSSQEQDNVTPKSKKDEPVLTTASTMDDYYNVYNGAKGFKAIRKEFGTIEAIKYTFNEQAQNASALLSAVLTFKGLDCSQQFNTIKGLYSGLTVALDNAKDSTMERLQNVTLRTFGATKEARKAAEERVV